MSKIRICETVRGSDGISTILSLRLALNNIVNATDDVWMNPMGFELNYPESACTTQTLFPNMLEIVSIRTYGNYNGLNAMEIDFARDFGLPVENTYYLGQKTADMYQFSTYIFKQDSQLLGFQAETKDPKD